MASELKCDVNVLEWEHGVTSVSLPHGRKKWGVFEELGRVARTLRPRVAWCRMGWSGRQRPGCVGPCENVKEFGLI